jgi:hypothetical protein
LAYGPVYQVVVDWEAFGAFEFAPVPLDTDFSSVDGSFKVFDGVSKRAWGQS